jgi:hypothetical protein
MPALQACVVVRTAYQDRVSVLLKQDGLTDAELLHIRQLHLQMDGPKLEPQAKVRAPYDSLHLKQKAARDYWK